MGGQDHASAALTPEETGTYFTGGRVGLAIPLDGIENLAPTRIPFLYLPAHNELLYWPIPDIK